MKDKYNVGRITMGSDYDFYNLVEKCLIEIELRESDKSWVEELDIKN